MTTIRPTSLRPVASKTDENTAFDLFYAALYDDPDAFMALIPDKGAGLHWPALDVDLTVPGLVSGIFGSKTWMSELGRAGGRQRSPARAAASRANGHLGGRPRKREVPA